LIILLSLQLPLCGESEYTK